MSRRLRLHFTPEQHERLRRMAEQVGLRPSQLAQRLLLRKLSRVPLANRQLWQELARSVANLTQLGGHLERSPTAQPELQVLILEVATELEAFRRELLGLPANAGGPADAPASSDDAGVDELPADDRGQP